MVVVVIQETGRVVYADAPTARRWIADGYAVLAAPLDQRETASRTSPPTPARLAGTETR